MPTREMTARVREGRLLELPEEAGDLHLVPGQDVRIRIDDAAAPAPNETMLAILRRIEESHRGRADTDGADTPRLIGEAREGAMYDRDAAE